MVKGRLMDSKPSIVTYDEDSDIVWVKLLHELNPDNISAHIEALHNALQKSKRGYQLIDASRIRNLVIDKKTREALRGNGTRLRIKRIAYVGLSPMSRMMFRALHTGEQEPGPEYGFFSTEDEAMAWLRKESPIKTEVVR
ncbi:STAS/SEC14 domain-containing protein [candidate division WOR-3 bacterium]|nr:STAS/SEC14 domain-containing protein [candidate division WOR-3 bacterium]